MNRNTLKCFISFIILGIILTPENIISKTKDAPEHRQIAIPENAIEGRQFQKHTARIQAKRSSSGQKKTVLLQDYFTIQEKAPTINQRLNTSEPISTYYRSALHKTNLTSPQTHFPNNSTYRKAEKKTIKPAKSHLKRAGKPEQIIRDDAIVQKRLKNSGPVINALQHGLISISAKRVSVGTDHMLTLEELPAIKKNDRVSLEKDAFQEKIKISRPSASISQTQSLFPNIVEQVFQDWREEYGGWEYSEKEKFQYDGNDNETLYEYYEWTGNSWVGIYKSEATYNAQGYPLIWIDYIWDHETGTFIPQDKYFFTYDTEGNLIEEIYQSWSMRNNAWLNISWDVWDNDEFGNEIFIEIYSWNPVSSAWVGNYKREFAYNSVGLMTLNTSYSWNSDKGGWCTEWKEETTFNDKQNVTMYRNWRGDCDEGWTGHYWEEYTYDTEGRETMESYYYWDFQTSKWVGEFKGEYTWYGTSWDELTEIYYEWKIDGAGIGTWIEDYKEEYAYTVLANDCDPTNFEKTMHAFYDWDSAISSWVGDYKETWTFDTQRRLTEYLELIWDESLTTPDWRTLYIRTQAYDTFGNRVLFKAMEWSDYYGMLVGIGWTQYTYDANNVMNYYENFYWDYGTMKWIGTLKSEWDYTGDLMTRDNYWDWDATAQEWVRDYQYTWTYNSNDQVLEEKYYEGNATATDWLALEKTVWTYASDGIQTLTSVTSDWNGSAWEESEKATWTYNGTTDYYMISLVSDGSGGWVNSSKNLVVYADANFDGYESRIYQYWDGSAWVNTDLVIRNFSDLNKVDLYYEWSTWNASTNTWEKYYKRTTAWDSQELHIIEEIRNYWSSTDNDWYVDSQRYYSYDANQNRTSYKSYFFNATYDTLIGSRWYERTFAADGTQLSYTNYYWNTSKGDWYGDNKWIRSYDASGREILYENWDWDWTTWAWYGDYKYKYAYDEWCNLIYEAYYYDYDLSQEAWIGSYKYEYLYDENGHELLDAKYYWNSDRFDWYGYYKDEDIIEYNSSGDIIYWSSSYYNNWDWNCWDWIGSNRYEMWYDETGFVTQGYAHYYFSTGNMYGWYGDYKQEYSHNTADTQFGYANYYWDWDRWDWAGSSKEYSEYDSNENLTYRASYYWDDYEFAWRGDYAFSRTFDASGLEVIEKIEYRWNDITWDWASKRKINKTFNSSEMITNRIVSRWSKTGQTWVYDYQETWVYDTSLNFTSFTRQYWVNGAWADQYRGVMTYNASGLSQDYYSEFWHGKRNIWVPNYRKLAVAAGSAPVAFDQYDMLAVPFESFMFESVFLGENLTYTLERGPIGMVVDAATGVITWPEPTASTSETLLVKGTNTTGSRDIQFDIHVLIEKPVITAITDVPGDQGWQVFLKWRPSLIEFKEWGMPVNYSIHEMDIDANWVQVGVASSMGITGEYNVLIPTFGNRLAEGDFTSTFKVVVHGKTPIESDESTGYSVDNLVPGIPSGMVVESTGTSVTLSWDEPVDSDFKEFQVFRGITSGFDPSGTNPISTTAIPSFIDESVESGFTYYYVISAVDINGNASDYSEEISADFVLGIEVFGDIPESFGLHQNYPNPFNPTTLIRYQLPEASNVRVSIYNIMGQEIATLINDYQEVGYKSIQWNGRDNFGNKVGGGLYLYRIQAGSFTKTMKMVLLK